MRDGERWWSFDEHGALHGEGEAGGEVGADFELMLDPARLIGLMRFEPLGRGERAGRAVLRAHAQLRADAYGLGRPAARLRAVFFLHHLAPGADSYDLEVDAEHGVLLSLEAVRAGEPFWSLSATDVDFDVEIPPETFHFTAPEGTQLKTLDDLFESPARTFYRSLSGVLGGLKQAFWRRRRRTNARG